MIPEKSAFETLHPESDFRAAMAAAGLDFPGDIIPDGQLHRIKVNGDRGPNCWYVLHLDRLPAGSFGCWKRGFTETWCAKTGDVLTEAERAERDRLWAKQREERDADRRRTNDEARAQAQKILDAARPATSDHPYLKRKGVQAHPGVLVGPWSQRQKDQCLLIPLRTAGGQLSTVQAIFPNKPSDGRDKDFLKGGSTKGAYFALGDLAAAPVIAIAEGYATAATIHEVTGHAAVMAVDAGNLRPVSEAIRALYPGKRIIIAADNDGKTEGNPGLKKATAAAKVIKADLAIPEFTEGEVGTDFNDLAQLRGASAVRQAIEQARPAESTGPAGAGAEPSLNLPTVSPCTHLANSYRIRHYFKGRIWYALGVGWILWAGKFWRPDPTNEGAIATGFVDSLSRRIAAEAGAITRRASEEADGDRRKALMTQAEALLKWAVQSENERTIAAGLKLTKHALLIEYSTLNADPWLFNCQNGTVDLRTGTLRPHDPADLITFLSPVVFDAAATCPTWLRFLSEVFAGDMDMVAFIQRAVGWSLTGVVKERALFFLYGDSGKNGKTTMVETIMKLVGACGESSYGYGRKVSADTFMKSKNTEDNQRKAASLAGPRFVCTSEVDEEHRLNEQLIKDITGGDTLEGRRLYQEAFTFKPQFKPWMYGNHKPEIRGTDDAIWSRVRLVPFEVSFKGREDLELADKLEAELSGIFNWAIQGCLDWQRHGLQPPAKVQAATQAYRDEMDVFGPFIAECCVIHRNAEVRANELWNAYKAWCAENGVKEQSQHKLGKYLNAKGTHIERSNGIKRIGIGLLEKHHSDSASTGTFGTFGTLKPESPIEKASKETFRKNLPKVPNLPNSADAGQSPPHPVDSTPADRNAPLPATASSDNKERF